MKGGIYYVVTGFPRVGPDLNPSHAGLKSKYGLIARCNNLIIYSRTLVTLVKEAAKKISGPATKAPPPSSGQALR